MASKPSVIVYLPLVVSFLVVIVVVAVPLPLAVVVVDDEDDRGLDEDAALEEDDV